MTASLSRLRAVLLGFRDLLHELSDQKAYARHLAEHNTVHSGAEWRRFSDERFRMKYQQVKCC